MVFCVLGVSMVWASVGGVKVRGLHRLPWFFLLAFAARKAALNSDGCIAVDLFRRGRIFFVVSVWATRDDMRTYVQQGAHRKFMAHRDTLFHFANNTVFEIESQPTRKQALRVWDSKFPFPEG